MKRITIITMIMLVLLINVVSAADEYYIDAKSILLSTVIPLKDSDDQATGEYRAIFDLNYAQELLDINTFGSGNNSWWQYDYRIWMSVAPQLPEDGVYWEIQAGAPCDYNPYNECPEFHMQDTLDEEWIDDNNVNFITLPYVLANCEFDCNYEGDPNTCISDDGGTDGYDEFVLDYHQYYQWNCIEGETPYKCENYAISDVLDTWPYQDPNLEPQPSPDYLEDSGTTDMWIKLDTQLREDMVFTCPGEIDPSKVRWSCTLRPDWRSRRNSITDAPYNPTINPDGWVFDDIFPYFTPIGNTNQDVEWSQCFAVNDTDVSYDAYNVTVEQAMSSAGIPYMGGEVITLTEFDKLVISKQRLINNKKQDLMNKNSFQVQLLRFTDIIANVFIFIWYIITAAILVSLFFIQMPKFFATLLEIFKEFMKIRKY